MRALRVTEAEYRATYRRLWGKDPAGLLPEPTRKAHKYGAKKVVIDGHTFPSKWEGQVYTELRWQYLAGLITEPLTQVPFSLGIHYGRERVYVADFVHIDLITGVLVVSDAKGMVTSEYKRKKKVFEELYQMPITEYRRRTVK